MLGKLRDTSEDLEAANIPETRKQSMVADCDKILAQLEEVEAQVSKAASSEDVAKVLSVNEDKTTNAELELKWLKEQIKKAEK